MKIFEASGTSSTSKPKKLESSVSRIPRSKKDKVNNARKALSSTDEPDMFEDNKPRKIKRKKKSDTEVIKKKKKKLTDLDIMEESTIEKPKKKKKKKKKLTKDNVLAQGSTLVKEMEGELLMMEMDNIEVADRQQMEQYHQMFTKLRDISIGIEKKCMKSFGSRDVYALLKCYAEMREIIADLRALKNIDNSVNEFNDDVLQPYAKLSTNAVLTFRQSVLTMLQQNCSTDEYSMFIKQIDQFAHGAGVEIDTGYQGALDRALELFAG